MKFTKKDISKEDSILILSKKDMKCLICGETTRYIDYCGECAICSSECMEKFNKIVDEQQ